MSRAYDDLLESRPSLAVAAFPRPTRARNGVLPRPKQSLVGDRATENTPPIFRHERRGRLLVPLFTKDLPNQAQAPTLRRVLGGESIVAVTQTARNSIFPVPQIGVEFLPNG